MQPPAYIDNAKVLKWAWSGSQPFGILRSGEGIVMEEVYGLAICQYPGDTNVCRFSCNQDWETVQDSIYHNVEDAIKHLPGQYKSVVANWRSLE